MTDFRAQCVADSAVFLNTDHFAEAVSYTPSGGVAVTRNAVINRSPVRPVFRGGQPSAAKIIEVHMVRDATLGVATVKERLDTVALKWKSSDASNTTFLITKIMSDDGFFWQLEAQA